MVGSELVVDGCRASNDCPSTVTGNNIAASHRAAPNYIVSCVLDNYSGTDVGYCRRVRCISADEVPQYRVAPASNDDAEISVAGNDIAIIAGVSPANYVAGETGLNGDAKYAVGPGQSAGGIKTDVIARYCVPIAFNGDAGGGEAIDY